MPGGEITIQATRHPNRLGRWITFSVTLSGGYELAMVLDSGAPVSAVSPETAAELNSLGLLQPPTSRHYEYRLEPLTIAGQALAAQNVRVLPRLSELRIAGLLGLDFLSQFTWVRFHVPTLRLFLELT